MDKIVKTYIGEIKSVDEKNYTVEAVVSDETVDRYQEVIKIDAWKGGLSEYKKHGVLLSSHNYGKLTNQIGVAEKIRVEDGKLVAKFKYFVNAGNEEADWGFYLAKQGFAAYSVGFLPKPGGVESAAWDDEDVKAGKKPSRVYNAVELLEVSQVTVPANPSALQKSIDMYEKVENEDLVVKEYLHKLYDNSLSEKKDVEEIIEDIKEDLESEVKDIEDILEEDKKKPKGGCKEYTEEEEKMILEAIESMKKEVLERIEKIELVFEKLETENLDLEKQIEEDLKKEEELALQKAQEDAEVTAKEEESYIVKILSDMNDELAKRISVQS